MYYTHLREGLTPVMTNYVTIIHQALAKLGHDNRLVYNVSDLPKGSNLLSVTARSTYLCRKLRKARNVITWFQGAAPEEMDLLYEGRIDRRPRVMLHRLFERYALDRSDLCVFVSQSMLEHVRRVYGYNRDNYAIMPCYSRGLNPDAFMPSRYRKPKFLFSGSMLAWQCIDRMFALFRKIKEAVPEATLTIFTLDVEDARAKASEAGIDIAIESVDADKLNRRMLDFKYGFIVRDDITVNNVATPTKMNDYMAAGLIPVYSDVVDAYRENIDTPYAIGFRSDDECVRKIVEFENRPIDTEAMKRSYADLFDRYWNAPKYIDMFADKIDRHVQYHRQ